MNNSIFLLYRLHNLPFRISARVSSTSNTSSGRSGRKRATSSSTNLSHLQGILSTMKVRKSTPLYDKISKYGNSDMFSYATNKKYSREELKAQHLETWNRIAKYELDNSCIQLPWNAFQELIMLTEQGKLWHFPIDNEQGLVEKDVPFEEHVFLQDYLKEFPNNEHIQTFMGFILSGLSRNYWMTTERKKEVIKFYKDYFEEKREIYKTVGFEM